MKTLKESYKVLKENGYKRGLLWGFKTYWQLRGLYGYSKQYWEKGGESFLLLKIDGQYELYRGLKYYYTYDDGSPGCPNPSKQCSTNWSDLTHVSLIY